MQCGIKSHPSVVLRNEGFRCCRVVARAVVGVVDTGPSSLL